MVFLLEEMWEVSGTVSKQARSATVSAQLSSNLNQVDMSNGGKDLKTLNCWRGGGVFNSAGCLIVPL